MTDDIITPITIVNEDGTSIDDHPKNPFFSDEWLKSHPVIKYNKPCKPYYEDKTSGNTYANYGCVLCSENGCPYSDAFKVPESDKDMYDKYIKDSDEYDRIHNPNLYRLTHSCNN